MLAASFRRSEVACAVRDFFAVQDTKSSRCSAGGASSFLHAMIAVDAVSGALLGALDALFLQRTAGGRQAARCAPSRIAAHPLAGSDALAGTSWQAISAPAQAGARV